MITLPELLSPIDPEAPLLVVAAHEEAEHLDSDWPILLTGIGRIRATFALTDVLARGPLPREIINIGTAGALKNVSGVHRVGHVELHDFSHSSIRRITGDTAYPPIQLNDDEDCLRLATGDVFLEDPAMRRKLAKRADLVDMEGYAIAWVARRYDVPVSLIKLVSDSAGRDAGKLWADGVEECSRVMSDFLSRTQVTNPQDTNTP